MPKLTCAGSDGSTTFNCADSTIPLLVWLVNWVAYMAAVKMK